MALKGASLPAGVEFLQVQTTTDSRAEAMELLRAAVQARLAAGGQVTGPVASAFWWNQEMERAEEWLLFLQTTAGRYAELAAFLTERHSYDDPEIIAVPIVAGTAPCLDWVREETAAAVPRQARAQAVSGQAERSRPR